MAIVLVNNGSKRLFVFAKLGQVINFDATVAEDLNSGFGKFVGNKNAGGHGGLL